MTDSELRLLSDTRLSREARIMGLHVASLGDGEHEVSHDDFRLILGRGTRGLAKDGTLAGYVQELVTHGWVERSPGGRGSPRYCFTPPQRGGREEGDAPTQRTSDPPWREGKDSDPPWREGKDSLSPPIEGGQSSRSSSSKRVDEEDERERGGSGGVLSEEAQEALEQHAEKLAGARGAIRDYLRHRVPPPLQMPWVHTVAGWLDGIEPSVWKSRYTGDTLPQDQWVHRLAAAVNELHASDEEKMARDIGDTGNLKTKLSIIIGRELRNGHRKDRIQSRGEAEGEAGGRGGLGSNHGRFVVEG